MEPKHKTNYFLLLVITIIGSILAYSIVQKTYLNIESYDTAYYKVGNTQSFTGDAFSKTSIGNLVFSYPTNWKLTNENNSIGLKPEFKTENLNNDIYKLDFIATYLKDNNKERLSTIEWVRKNTDNGIANEKGTDITLGNIGAYHEFYYDRMSDEIGYFSPVILTITHGTDVYEIFIHELPTKLNSDLTPSDIQAAKEYEQTVDQIIQSFKFSD